MDDITKYLPIVLPPPFLPGRCPSHQKRQAAVVRCLFAALHRLGDENEQTTSNVWTCAAAGERKTTKMKTALTAGSLSWREIHKNYRIQLALHIIYTFAKIMKNLSKQS